MSVQRPPFEIFRGKDAPLTQHDDRRSIMEDITPTIAAGLSDLSRAASGGAHITVPYCRPEMNLEVLQLKSGFTLPLHSHDCDCLYYVAGGSITIGTEELKAGDGFFVGTDVPYGYQAGPEGAIVLEFRSVDTFNIKFQLRTEQSWATANGKNEAARQNWAGEKLPELT